MTNEIPKVPRDVEIENDNSNLMHEIEVLEWSIKQLENKKSSTQADIDLLNHKKEELEKLKEDTWNYINGAISQSPLIKQ